MPRKPFALLLVAFALAASDAGAPAAEPLHERVDALVEKYAQGGPAAPAAEAPEFLRRVYLDLAGRIPSAGEARAFLADGGPGARTRLIEKLLDGPDYARRMQELFQVMLMERLGDHPAWSKFLRESFRAGKPWDRLVRELLRGVADDEATRGAPFFLAKRLEHYGENPVDYPGLTTDLGRIFLGVDLRCAQCHDHLFIGDYKQRDFQGLYAFIQNASLHDIKAPSVAEKPTTEKLTFASVFTKVKHQTGPRVPGGGEVEIPAIEKGKEYARPPDAKTRFPGRLKFSPLAELAERLPSPDNPRFTRNIVNRLWFVMMGRGLVEPLDQHHSENPPSNPELLDLLASEFAAHGFDVKWLLRELALSRTYQRSGLRPDDRGDLPPARSFLVANLKRLSAEQLFWSVLEAAGRDGAGGAGRDLDALRERFVKAFANEPREPEEEFNPSLKSALFLLNDGTVLSRLEPRSGNLVDRLSKLGGADAVADELYLSVLTRPPSAEERAEVAEYLDRHADRRAAALGRLAWALLASTEFCVNH